MGFSRWKYVQGRASIADLFKPGRRCGIYVLRFSNEEFYVGQAVDVTRRYAQHRKIHADIEQMAFKQMPRGKLDEEERSLIWRLERQGWPLRNVIGPSIPRGESDFDLVMPPEEQERWLGDLGYADESGERLIDPELRRRFRGHFQRFLGLPRAEEALDVLRTYVKVGIPAIRRGEVSFWACSCLPTKDVYSRVNLYWQEVFTVSTSLNDLRFSFHLARSPLVKAFGSNESPLLKRHPTLRYIDHRYGPGGQDQTNYEVRGAKAAKELLADEDVLRGIRLFNLRLMQKGPSNFGRYHCMDLADRLLAT
ncbi:MAG: hypothetical protein H0V18_16160 [Pyrinomonadaceae bacterium]|nr:hypothetical protein [Pyrinomonadaceae bacterium]